MVDIASLKAKYKAQRSDPSRIFAVVLGERGMGKSGTSAGTWAKGTKILHLAFVQEDHGLDSSSGIVKDSDDLIPVLVDLKADGTKMTPAEAFDATLAYLNMDMTGVDVVVVDGLSALDTIVANHPKVTGAKGYDGKKVSDLLFDELLTAFKKVGMAGKHIVITCSTEVRIVPDGVYKQPSLRGGSSINSIIGSCSEILAMDKVSVDGKTTYVFTFDGPDVQKSGKKMNGEGYSLVVEPRIAGVPSELIPAQMKASFAYLLKYKKDSLAKKG